MRSHIGIFCSVVGASVAFYLAALPLMTLPESGNAKWFAIAGLVTISLGGGLLVNAASIASARHLSNDLRETSRLYNSLTTRLSPLLYNGLEDLLQRRTQDQKLLANCYATIVAPVDGLYRVVATTFPSNHPIRQIQLAHDEGFVGFISTRKVPGYSRAAFAGADVFDCATAEVIGQRGAMRDINKAALGRAGAWVYQHPIFENAAATPWSNRVVGMLVINALNSDADQVFRNFDFQLQINSLAADVAPYLDALHTLLAENEDQES